MPPERTTRRLTREIVVEEAMVVLDEGGYEALTIRRLAERLGVVPMAVYRHVTNKDDLTDALLDLAVSRVPLPDPNIDWRNGLRQLAHSIRDTLLQHPGIITPLVNKPALGSSSLQLAEFGFSVMRSAGFDATHTTRSVNAVITYTIGFATLEIPRRHAGFEANGTGTTSLDVAFEQLAPSRYPHTIELRPAPAEFVSDEQFDYGLERLLDGIADHHPTRPHTVGITADAAQVVVRFHERMQARDWAAAEQLLSPAVHIEYSATGERFDGPNFLAMNRAFPEGWSITVLEALAVGDRVASQVRVDHGDDVFWCAGFYTVVDGAISEGTEHWVTERSEQPPVWRLPYTTS